MAEKLCIQKVGDITFTMMQALGFDNNSQVALFVDGATEPVVILGISDRGKDTISIKAISTNIVRVKKPDKGTPGASSNTNAPTLSDVR